MDGVQAALAGGIAQIFLEKCIEKANDNVRPEIKAVLSRDDAEEITVEEIQEAYRMAEQYELTREFHEAVSEYEEKTGAEVDYSIIIPQDSQQ